MRSLTTKQRLTFLFMLYFCLFLVILGTLFIAIFRILYLRKISSDLGHDFVEVTNDTIGMDSQGVYFKKDKNGDTLRTLLFNDNVSALFFDKSYQIVRSYGVFETNKTLTDDWNSVQDEVQQAVRADAVREYQIQWDGAPFTVLITPLKHDSVVVGAMLLAKSHDELAQVEDSLITILVALGGLGLFGSFIIGFLFTRSALSPLRNIIRSIEATHLNKLEGRVKLSGNPDDEMVILANRYNEMLARIDQMSARQKEFIANASHELRTPLTRAILSLDGAVMENPGLPPEVKDAKNDLWDLNRLLDQLLVLGQIKEGVLPQGMADVKKVVDMVIKRYDNELRSRDMSVVMDIKTFPVPVPEDYFAIVLSNLISNAIKYSPPSSLLYMQSRPEEKTLLVRDNGVGMTKDELTSLFDRFYRGKSVRHTTRGYGLGLSLVKEICDEYKIRLEYRSEKGKGTTATMIFSSP